MECALIKVQMSLCGSLSLHNHAMLSSSVYSLPFHPIQDDIKWELK